LTYRDFVEPLDLITIIQKTYLKLKMNLSSYECDIHPSILLHRLASFAKEFLVTCPEDFVQDEIQAYWQSFLEIISCCNDNQYMDKFMIDLPQHSSNNSNLSNGVIKSRLFDPITININFDILDYNVDEIAKCLTMIDSEAVCALKGIDMIRFSGYGNDKFHLVDSNVICTARFFVERYNSIGYWVVSVIHTQHDQETKLKVIEFFILVANTLAKFSNFSSCMV
jgi:hypothetical protein